MITYVDAKTKAEVRTGAEMNKTARKPLANGLSKIVDLLVESRIRIDAMEQILVKSNSVAYPLYLDMIENLQRKKTAEVNRVLTRKIKSKPTER